MKKLEIKPIENKDRSVQLTETQYRQRTDMKIARIEQKINEIIDFLNERS